MLDEQYMEYLAFEKEMDELIEKAKIKLRSSQLQIGTKFFI